MKTIAISSIFVLFTLVVGTALVPLAFADHAKASVSIPKGASAPGCEATNECYVPHEVTVDVGGEVTWSNDDTAAHTVTSGTPEGGPDAVFDSSLFMAGNTFSHKFDKAGTFHYFCMVHPWMVGSVIVQEAGAEEHKDEGTHDEGMAHEGMTEVKGMSQDGSVQVELKTSTPTKGEKMTIDIEFTDKNGKYIEHINHDITATQNGKSVLNDMGAHHHDGKGEHMTAVLDSADPVDIKVTLNGIGLPDKQSEWTGPKGEVIMFQVVPEFGTIAMMILGVAIVSIVAVSARSKIMPRI